ncbi:MAG: hypothetical protein AB7I33_03705 [Gemmatimonadales bacterium]
MPKRSIEVDGDTWSVTLSGRVTQYTRDEVSLMFTRGGGSTRERRICRFSPLGARSPEAALEELTDQQLRRYLAASQPAWTAPEAGYSR